MTVTRSYYEISAQPYPAYAPLSGPVDCDVAIVGGGITGLTCALWLAGRGYSVVLLEAQGIGAGGSGRSGGQVLPGLACEMQNIERLLDPARARAVWDISQAAVGHTRAMLATHHIDCDWRDGHLSVALKARQSRELRAAQALLATRYGYDHLEYLEGEALARRIASRRYCAALYDARAGHLHPLNYTLGLARAATAAGVRIFEHSAATGVRGGVRPTLASAGGTVRARQVVLAGGAYLHGVAPAIERKIMPVGSYIIATSVIGAARAEALLPGNAAVTDVNFVLDYFRRSADERLLFGGRVSYSRIVPPRLAQSMRGRMLRVFPSLRDVAVDCVWGGYVDITMNRAPHFGRVDGNIYFAQGFSGHGMALAGMAGKLLAEALAGDTERFDLFARIPHRDFPGGDSLRTPMLVLAMLYYRLRDLL